MKLIKVDQQYDRQICQALDMTMMDDYEEQEEDQEASSEHKVADVEAPSNDEIMQVDFKSVKFIFD